MGKCLIAYFTKTGNSKKISGVIASKLNCDIDEIVDKKQWRGPIGFILGGYNAVKEKETQIEYSKNPEDYDVVVLVSPVWASKIPPATRTYLNQNKSKIKKLAILMNNSGSDINESIEYIKKLVGESTIVQGITMNGVPEKVREGLIEDFSKTIKTIVNA